MVQSKSIVVSCNGIEVSIMSYISCLGWLHRISKLMQAAQKYFPSHRSARALTQFDLAPLHDLSPLRKLSGIFLAAARLMPAIIVGVSICCLPNMVWGQKSAKKGSSTTKSGSTQTGPKSDSGAVRYYADAAGYQNNGAFPLAIEEWRKLIKEFPNDPLVSKAWHYLGVCHMQSEKPDYQAAIDAFTSAMADPKMEVREEALINLGWCYFTQGRSASQGSDKQLEMFAKARENLQAFLKTYGDGSYADQALFYLGEIEYTIGSKTKSIAYYEQLLRSKSLSNSSLRPDTQYALGVAHEENKDDQRALEIYDAYLKEHPKHRLVAEVSMRKADILLRTGQPAEAEQLLQEIAELPNNPTADYALLRRAYALSQQNKLKESAQQFRELTKKFPKSNHALSAALQAGQVHFRLGQWEEAQIDFSQVLEPKDAQAAEAAHWLSLALMRQGKAAEAVKMLEASLAWAKKTPGFLNLRMDLADALYEIPDRLDEARKLYETIASDAPEDPLAPRAAYNAAFAALQTGKLDDASKWSELFLSKYPQDPLRNDVAYVAAESLLQRAEHEASAAAYSKLIEADPANPSQPMWNLRLAMAFYLGGKYQTAIDRLQTYMPKFSEAKQKAESQFIMGACYLFLDNLPLAIEQLQASHASSNNWNQADEVLQLLAQAQQRSGQSDVAIKTLESILQKYATSRLRPQVEYRIGQISAGQARYPQAIARYQAIINNPQAKTLHDYAQYGIAWCHMQQDKFQPALDALKPLLAENRQDSIAMEAILAQGVCLRKLGQIDDAHLALKRFMDAKPTGLSLANGLYELGMTLVEKKSTEEAIATFERITNELPDYPALDKVLYELGWGWTDKQDVDKGTKYFQQLVDKFPKSELAPESLYQVAQQQYNEQRYPQAATLYSKVAEQTRSDDLQEKAFYKLGWSLFQQNKFKDAAEKFQRQAELFPEGRLTVDALFMQAECQFKEDSFGTAYVGFQQARKLLEASVGGQPTEQVASLIYLHGAQCLREQKKWSECESWLNEIVTRFPKSPYMSTVLYELGFCKQSQNQLPEALKYYAEASSKYRDESAARCRYMMGEVYFAQRDFAKAIPEFQRVMFGFGGAKATPEIKNWQARSAFEAGRCSDVLIQDLKGDARTKAIQTAIEFYKYIVENQPDHTLTKQAQARLSELKQLR